jgi:H+-transporting ATPase
MRMVLGISTVLGVIGVVAAFGLFYLGERVFKLDQGHVQTLMYLKLSVAGHLTIFLTRTRGRFWTIRPARILLLAVFGTQAVATLIAVFGVFMTPLGWGWALFVWGYALAWFLVNDQVKVLAYRILDPAKAKAKAKAKADAADADTDAEPPATAKPKADAAAKPEPKATPAVAKPKPTAKPKSTAAAWPKPKTPADLTPQLVKRVHEMYEDLGREEVQAVEDMEKADGQVPKGEPDE